jgi:hypothetical protein
MSYITDHKQKFEDLEYHIKNQEQLRLRSNGGNTILFSYPPEDEYLYIENARKIYHDRASFIEISSLLVRFIEQVLMAIYNDPNSANNFDPLNSSIFTISKEIT